MSAQRRLHGIAAAPGTARGPWALVRRASLPTGEALSDGPGAADAAVAQIEAAAQAAGDDLLAISERVAEAGHDAEADIFAAHAAIAWDPQLLREASDRVRRLHVGPVDAVLGAAGEFASQLASLDDAIIRARSADVLDVADRIARHIAGLPVDEATLLEPAIVVGEDLSPSLTATLPRERMLAIVLEAGSPTAHAAILARAYGIPCVVGVGGLLGALDVAGGSTGSVELAVDGAIGEVVVAPDAAVVADFDARAAAGTQTRARDLAEACLPAVTLDGTEATLLANIGSAADATLARDLGARGVGLFRTEFLFLERTTAPSEDEQAAAYREAVEAFGGDPVTIRLLDVGGDKAIPYLPIPHEENPFLGVRALRLAAERPELFVTQLRACYRAAVAGPVKIMAPMVADARDAERLLALASTARDSLVADGIPAGDAILGVMLEIPSAILAADGYFDRIGFASLGTNDLTQYTLAVDRGNPALERYRDAMHPAVLRLVAMAVDAAARAGIALSVCGEMAGDPVAALALVGLGVRQLSMGAAALPAVRRAIRSVEVAALQAAALAAVSDPSAEAARGRFAELLAEG